jgi:hypothetical protein
MRFVTPRKLKPRRLKPHSVIRTGSFHSQPSQEG